MGKVARTQQVLRVGLTGGIASGKSLVAAMFALCGAPVAYADTVARELMEQEGEVKLRLLSLLGPQLYLETGQLNRKWLAARMFNDTGLKAKVNAIVHPAVGLAAKGWHEAQSESFPYTIYESALLFEADLTRDFDLILLVHAPASMRLQRAMQRDKAEEAEILARMKAQWSDEQRLAAEGAELIHNDGEHSLIRQVWNWHHRLSDWAQGQNRS